MNPQRQLLLGIFFIVALSILAFYTLFLTDIRLFSKPILMNVYFSDANGLREGDPVQVLGTRIGRVKEFSVDTSAEEKKRVHTILSLEREVELLEGASITIRETSLLGGRHVDINPGLFGGKPLESDLDGTFYGSVYKNPIAMLGDIGTLFNENRESITQAFVNIRKITDDVAQGKGLVGRLVTDEALGDDGRQVVADARAVMADVRDASAQLREAKGLAGALLYDETIKQRFNDTLARLERIGASLEGQEGLLGALINDPGLRERAQKGIDSFASFGEKLDHGDGVLAMLMNDTEAKEKLKTLIGDLSSTMADVKTLVADARAGKGTIGKLLTEDALHEDLRKAVSVLTRSLEDFREAAPITAFTGALFAAF